MLLLQKRIHRFMECIPDDWEKDIQMFLSIVRWKTSRWQITGCPFIWELPIRHKHICHEPMLGPINIEPYLATGKIEYVLCGGESESRQDPAITSGF